MPHLPVPRALLGAILAVLAFGYATAAMAQVPPGSVEAEPVSESGAEVADPFGRGTPRGMVEGLLAALGSGDLERTAAYLDLSGVPEPLRAAAGERLALALETVLDRSGEIVPSFRLSTDPMGLQDDGLVAGVDVFAEVVGAEEDIPLTAHRVEGPEGQPIWLVSPDALDAVSRLVTSTRVGLVDRLMPEAWGQTRLGGAALSHWIALGLLALVALALARALVTAVAHTGRRVWTPLDGSRRAALGRATRLPLGLLLACGIYGAGIRLLGVSIVARALVGPVIEITAWVALGALAWRLVDTLAGVWLDGMSRRGQLGAISVVTLLRRAGKLVVAFLAALAVFTSLGVDLTGWLAAFGLGGLAIALGAQKTIEHFVGSVSLVADRPVRVGDFCQVDGLLGTVEDIGMRSTRIRTLERTLVTIPNGIMSGARIENYGSRDQFLFKRVLNLRYETTAEQMREVLKCLRTLLLSDIRVTADPARVRFTAFGPSSLDIEIFAYVKAIDYNEFLATAEDLHLSILEIVPACGTGFAFPSTSVYLEGLRGAKPESATPPSNTPRPPRAPQHALS